MLVVEPASDGARFYSRTSVLAIFPQPVSPSIQTMQILWLGAMVVQAIHVVAKLPLADLVVSGPKGH